MRAIDSRPARGIPSEPLAWLIRVARNTMNSHFRRARPQLVEPALLDLIESRPSAAADDPAAASIVNWGLARLRRTHAERLEGDRAEGRYAAGLSEGRDAGRGRRTTRTRG
jgi:DNA-directed RNA polymerase specialized sigma24 family protein